MQGRDKGLIALAGRPLIAHAAERLRPQAASLWISANRNHERYRLFAERVISDELDGFQGPLAGIATALAAAQTPWLLVAPCDTPLLPMDLGRRLADGLAAQHAAIAIAADRERVQPLHALIPTAVAADLGRYLATGERSVMGWLAGHRLAVVAFADAGNAFRNANTPDDLAALAGQLPSHRPG
jgi:molybdopterin-guanine dinucleotide biosynthesis protein A